VCTSPSPKRSKIVGDAPSTHPTRPTRAQHPSRHWYQVHDATSPPSPSTTAWCAATAAMAVGYVSRSSAPFIHTWVRLAHTMRGGTTCAGRSGAYGQSSPCGTVFVVAILQALQVLHRAAPVPTSAGPFGADVADKTPPTRAALRFVSRRRRRSIKPVARPATRQTKTTAPAAMTGATQVIDGRPRSMTGEGEGRGRVATGGGRSNALLLGGGEPGGGLWGKSGTA